MEGEIRLQIELGNECKIMKSKQLNAFGETDGISKTIDFIIKMKNKTLSDLQEASWLSSNHATNNYYSDSRMKHDSYVFLRDMKYSPAPIKQSLVDDDWFSMEQY